MKKKTVKKKSKIQGKILRLRHIGLSPNKNIFDTQKIKKIRTKCFFVKTKQDETPILLKTKKKTKSKETGYEKKRFKRCKSS